MKDDDGSDLIVTVDAVVFAGESDCPTIVVRGVCGFIRTGISSKFALMTNHALSPVRRQKLAFFPSVLFITNMGKDGVE